MGDGEESIHFLKKPLFYWVKSFAENEVRREDTFSKFLGSDALNYVLEYIGIQTEIDQSSLHLSSIFDEEFGNSVSVSLTSNNSSRSKYSTNQYENELKQRMHKFNRIFNELRSYYEDHFSQIITLRPPNSVHIVTACESCSVEEYEKILLLLLGAAVNGNQGQETIRKIRGFPNHVQTDLIASIKKISEDKTDILNVKPWIEVSKLSSEEQQKIYDSLLSFVRKLTYERNEAVQSQLIADYYLGIGNCEQRKEQESRGFDSLDFEKYSDDYRSNVVMRQLREELTEKSDLLKECRDELEMTKGKLQHLQTELNDTQSQLRALKKTRDELDVLKESQTKALRLEAELLKMKKKLEESEQYYERVEILQNENRTYQRKHAILMDQINVLTVEKERLEVSFMTHQSHRSPRVDSEDEFPSFSFIYNTPRKIETYADELLLSDDDGEKISKNQKTSSSSTIEFEKVCEESKTKESKVEESLKILPPAEEEEPINEKIEDVLIIPPKIHVIEPEVNSLELDESKSEILESNIPKYKDAETQNGSEEIEITSTPTSSSRSSKERRRGAGGPKRGHHHRKTTATLTGKKTKKSLFPYSKVTLQKVTPNFSSVEKLDEIQEPDENVDDEKKSHKKRSLRRKHKLSRRAERNQTPTPPSPPMQHRRKLLKNESDADEELSISPNPSLSGHIQVQTNSNEIYHLHPNDSYQPISSDLEPEDNELFFVCSTLAPGPPPMARNVRIYAPSREPHHPRPPYQDILNSQSERSLSPQQPINTRCSIEVNFRHTNAHNHQFNLIESDGFFERPNQPIVMKHNNYTPENVHASSSEDDDSVWYEYGCV